MKVFKLLSKKDSFEHKKMKPISTSEGSMASADFIRHESSLEKYDHRKMSHEFDEWPVYKYNNVSGLDKTASVEVIPEANLSNSTSEPPGAHPTTADVVVTVVSSGVGDPSEEHLSVEAPQRMLISQVTVNNELVEAQKPGNVALKLEASGNPFEDEETGVENSTHILPEQTERQINKRNSAWEASEADSTTNPSFLSLPTYVSKRPSVQDLVECWENMADKENVPNSLQNYVKETSPRSNPFDDDCSIDLEGLTTGDQGSQDGSQIGASDQAVEDIKFTIDMDGKPDFSQALNEKSPTCLKEGVYQNNVKKPSVVNNEENSRNTKWSFMDQIKRKASFSDDVFPRFGSGRWLKRKMKHTQDLFMNLHPLEQSSVTMMVLGVIALLVLAVLFAVVVWISR